MDNAVVETKEDILHVEDAQNGDSDGGLHIKRRGANTQLDDAFAILDSAGGQSDASPEDRKRILRKLDLYVCVPMCIYLYSSAVSGISVAS